MIRVHDARFGIFRAGLAIIQFNLLALRDGFGQRVENFQIQNRLGARAEGNGLLDVGEVERNGVGQRLLHFFDGARAAVFQNSCRDIAASAFSATTSAKSSPSVICIVGNELTSPL